MKNWTVREWILLALTAMVLIVVTGPMLALTFRATFWGQNIAKESGIEAVAGIVTYVLGLLSGYVLKSPSEPPPKE